MTQATKTKDKSKTKQSIIVLKTKSYNQNRYWKTWQIMCQSLPHVEKNKRLHASGSVRLCLSQMLAMPMLACSCLAAYHVHCVSMTKLISHSVVKIFGLKVLDGTTFWTDEQIKSIRWSTWSLFILWEPRMCAKNVNNPCYTRADFKPQVSTPWWHKTKGQGIIKSGGVIHFSYSITCLITLQNICWSHSCHVLTDNHIINEIIA